MSKEVKTMMGSQTEIIYLRKWVLTNNSQTGKDKHQAKLHPLNVVDSGMAEAD